MSFRPTLDRRIYEAALYLYPPAFRREFSAEMLQDFDDAQAETWCRRGRRALFLVHLALDLARSAVWQWLRSGLPAVVVLSAGATLISVSIAGMSRAWPPGTMALPSSHADRELLGLLILATVALLVIAMTIVLTIWATPIRRLQRRRR
jgi:hypothetical protein